MSRVLVGEGVPASGQLVATLRTRGCEVTVATDFESTEAAMRAALPDLVIVDAPFTRDGELVTALQRVDSRVPIIVLRKDGESVDPMTIVATAQRLLDSQRSRRREIAINVREQRHGIDPFTGTSPAMEILAERANRMLDSHAPLLIQGETGSGKGVLAAWFHHHGPRAEEAFVDINCAGLSRELVESELFGHERGAFTGAVASKLGLLDVGHRGTVFLDEIGEIDLLTQPHLLKVVEEKRFRRVGDVRDRSVDIRLIAATHRDLAKRAREGTFRADLFFRISTLVLTIPPLRQRREDILVLARLIANDLGHDLDFSSDALRALQAYEWPGNVRELRNVIERAILISNRGRITPGDLVMTTESAVPSDEGEPGTLLEAERAHIQRVLRFENGSIERAAQRLGISRSTLYQKLRRDKT